MNGAILFNAAFPFTLLSFFHVYFDSMKPSYILKGRSMNTKKRQLGLSVWGILGIIIVVLIVFWIAIEVVPEYMAASTIDSCLQDSQAAANGNANNLKSHFEGCLNQNAVYDFSDYEMKMQGKNVTLHWLKVLPMFGNIALQLTFDEQAPE
jgi:hypothetical protein